jgi:phage-related protein
MKCAEGGFQILDKPFSFEFGAVNSQDMGINATSYDFIAPPKRNNRIEIPRRHGTHKFAGTYYQDRILRLQCFWLDKAENFTRADIREISYWLSQRSKIVLDCEPDKYYIGEIYEPSEMQIQYNRAKDDMRSIYGLFELNFLCDPFAYGEQRSIKLENGVNNVDYFGTAETPTMIVIRNPNNFAVSNISVTAIQQIKA